MTLLEKKILAILSEPQLTYPQRLKELAAGSGEYAGSGDIESRGTVVCRSRYYI